MDLNYNKQEVYWQASLTGHNGQFELIETEVPDYSTPVEWDWHDI